MYNYHIDADGYYNFEVVVDGTEYEIVDKGRVINKMMADGKTEIEAVAAAKAQVARILGQTEALKLGLYKSIELWYNIHRVKGDTYENQKTRKNIK